MLIRPEKLEFPVTELEQIRIRKLIYEPNNQNQLIHYIKLSGENAEEFSYVIAKGVQNGQIIKVFFHPEQPGIKEAVLHIVNEQGEIAVVDITGKGTLKKLVPRRAAIQFAQRHRQRLRLRRLKRFKNKLKKM